MRLVLTYSIGDGCTYHCDEVLPVEYESGEALLVDFEAAARKANGRLGGDFTFAGHLFSADHFFERGTYYGPEVLTVDEWFGQQSIG